MLAVNVTANWHLIRTMHALLLRSDAGRVVFLTSGAAANPRAYRGLYSMTKGALEAMARTYANETVSTPIKVNLFAPGPTRTRMRAAVAPGEDPMTLADGRGGRRDHRADVPAELSRKPERSTTSAPAGSIRSARRRSAPSSQNASRERGASAGTSPIAAESYGRTRSIPPARHDLDRDGVRPLHHAVIVGDEIRPWS